MFYHHWGIENSNQSNDVIKDYETNETDFKTFPSGGFFALRIYFWFLHVFHLHQIPLTMRIDEMNE